MALRELLLIVDFSRGRGRKIVAAEDTILFG
jgi:hypothetical protein